MRLLLDKTRERITGGRTYSRLVSKRWVVKVKVEPWESPSALSVLVPRCLHAAPSTRSPMHSSFPPCPNPCAEERGKNTPAQVF